MSSTLRRNSGLSRRGFLVVAGLAALGAGAGVATGLLVDRSPDDNVPAPSPQTLLSAAAAERALLAAVDSALAAGAAPRPLLRQVRADHVAHLDAILAAVALATGAATPSAAPTPQRPPSSVGRAQLHAGEQGAAAAAARRALSLTGRDAALLASISACEATHAELLS